MENRKLIILFSLVLGLAFSRQAFAYETPTHAFLTKEALDFYNQEFSNNKISKEFNDSIISGSQLEDTPPRWMNHFYDPVNNRGLTALPGDWASSKDWAQNSNRQISALYNPILNTTIAGLLAVANPAKLETTDFTWKRAIKDYIKGDKQRAFEALGHILHLIEDVSVPDHTRNDPHPAIDASDTLKTGSPYEIWTSRFNLDNPDNNLSLRLANKKPVSLNSLGEYFDGLAKYSNNNFYSKDTVGIQSGYKLPEPDYDVRIDKYFYPTKIDKEFGDYVLFRKSVPDILLVNEFDITLGDDKVMNDYWSRLSVKSVQYSAGVIDLFFKEVEKYKNDQNFLKEEPKFFGAQVVSAFKGLINKIFGNASNGSNDKLALISEVALDKKDAATQNTADVGNLEILQPNNNLNIGDSTQNNLNTPDIQDEDAAEAIKQKPTTDQDQLTVGNNATKSVSQVCTFNTNKTSNHQNLLINEIAWMGGPMGANDEWLELKNISGGELDISGWQLLDKEEQIKITFSEKTKLSASGFMLLERTDDNSVPGIAADVVYTGALSNIDEGLRLFDNECNLVDEVSASSDWPAGIAGARRTMERQVNLSWNTYGGNGETPSTGSGQDILIMGTPRKENGSIVFFPSGSIQPTSNQTAAVSEPVPSTGSGQAKILISEIQITGGTGKSNNDFIELYNPNNFQVNLSGYRLVKRTKVGESDTSIKSWTSDAFIPAKGYYLWANSDYADIALAPDAATSVTLANDNGVAVRFGAENTGTIIDSVGWGLAANNFVEMAVFNENPIANQSISRRSENDTNNNSVDFIKSKLTSKNSSVSGGFLAPEQWGSQAAMQINHIVISEAYPDRTGANQDFVELYNPNPSGSPDIDTSNWSLQILSANATSTAKITKKNFEAGNKIPASGFFLIGIDNYLTVDMNWISGSLNSTDGATIFLVNGTTTIVDFDDSRIIDQIAYGSGSGIMAPENTAALMPDSGKSLERKAYQNEACVFSQDIGEFLGNGCDSDNNAVDFEMRSAPNPQSSFNLIEPRLAPMAVQDLNAAYDSASLKITLNWGESQDYSGATSSMKYAIKYATSTVENPKDLTELSAITAYEFITNEVGATDEFFVYAKDKDGLLSDPASTTLEIPGFLAGAFLYTDPRSASTTALELKYNSYPYIPNLYWDGDGWKVLVFYKNQDAPALPYFYSDTQYATTPDGVFPKQYGEWGSEIPGAWKTKYANCSGVSTDGTALILPDSSDRCSNSYGGIRNSTLNFNKLEDLDLIVSLSDNQPAPVDGDYMTIGFYSYAGNNEQKLVAVDRTKYYFQDSVPSHESPSAPENIDLSFNQTNSLLRIIWDDSMDSDTLDSLIKYEINYMEGNEDDDELDSNNWISKPNASLEPGEASEIDGRSFTKISVEPEKTYLIGVRAVDDFGNYSDTEISSYSVPEIEAPYGISDFKWGRLSDPLAVELSFNANPYPFMESNKTTAIIFFLNQNPPINYHFSNFAGWWEVGGVNDVLQVQYEACASRTVQPLGGLFMHNKSSCPNSGEGFKTSGPRSDLEDGQTLFVTGVSGVLNNGAVVAHEFSADDYITAGFYELRGNTFEEAATYNKKVYFQEDGDLQ